jgi:predicted phage replisome organizer
MNLSFIKLDINIMDDTKIKIIRKMPDGAKLFELWIGILCLAMKSSRAGTLEIGIGIPFTEESLSDHLDLPLKTTRMGLQVFKKFNMIEVWEDGTIFISNFEKHQQLEKIEKSKESTRMRVAKFREKQRISLDVTGTKLLRNAIDIDKETDKETDKDVTLRYSEEEIKEESRLLWISIYLNNAGCVEIDFVSELFSKYGKDKTKKILMGFREQGFHNIKTMRSSLDETGNIKPKNSKEVKTLELNQ